MDYCFAGSGETGNLLPAYRLDCRGRTRKGGRANSGPGVDRRASLHITTLAGRVSPGPPSKLASRVRPICSGSQGQGSRLLFAAWLDTCNTIANTPDVHATTRTSLGLPRVERLKGGVSCRFTVRILGAPCFSTSR